MILSMALLALSDLLIKLASQKAPLGQIIFFLSLGGTFLFVCLAIVFRTPLITRDILHPMVLLRNACEMFAGLFLILGIALTPLTTFAAIIQIAPILVVLGGALFLKESVGWRRWAAVTVGLIGMLIVVRPWSDGFSPSVVFAILGVSGLAARDLITRLSPAHIPALSLSAWGVRLDGSGRPNCHALAKGPPHLRPRHVTPYWRRRCGHNRRLPRHNIGDAHGPSLDRGTIPLHTPHFYSCVGNHFFSVRVWIKRRSSALA